MKKKLVLESTQPFNGLAELVAYDEGLFAKEGLAVEWADPAPMNPPIDSNPLSASHNQTSSHAAHGKLLESGKADMYNACEWGNYCRVADSNVGSRQVGRRSIVTYVAIVVRPDSPVYTLQQLAGKSVGVSFYAGTHYLALHLLSGFLPREEINVVDVGPGASSRRLKMTLAGEMEATALSEPYVSLAEKKGCRIIASAFHNGSEVVSDRIDAETYAAFSRAVREAVRRINANKAAYLHYFIDYYKDTDPEVAALSVADLNVGRIQLCNPAPIPEDEIKRTFEWVKSWGMIEKTQSPLEIIDMNLSAKAHAALQ